MTYTATIECSHDFPIQQTFEWAAEHNVEVLRMDFIPNEPTYFATLLGTSEDLEEMVGYEPTDEYKGYLD